MMKAINTPLERRSTSTTLHGAILQKALHTSCPINTKGEQATGGLPQSHRLLLKGWRLDGFGSR
jgi:hypothetical protein